MEELDKMEIIYADLWWRADTAKELNGIAAVLRLEPASSEYAIKEDLIYDLTKAGKAALAAQDSAAAADVCRELDSIIEGLVNTIRRLIPNRHLRQMQRDGYIKKCTKIQQ